MDISYLEGTGRAAGGGGHEEEDDGTGKIGEGWNRGGGGRGRVIKFSPKDTDFFFLRFGFGVRGCNLNIHTNSLAKLVCHACHKPSITRALWTFSP